MTRTFAVVRAPPAEPSGPPCFICNVNRAPLDGYPNILCRPCDQTATTLEGAPPWHSSDTILDPTKPRFYNRIEADETHVRVVNVDIMGDDGANPVFVREIQCWRRYRFGGWITMADPQQHTTLAAFYAHHYGRGTDAGCA